MFEGLAGRTRNEAEATVVEFLRKRADEILEFTCELIRTPSVNPPGDEVPISKVILEKLRMLGVTERQIVGALDERPNVLAHVQGTEPGRTLMLSGHIDTKPPGNLDEWKTNPHEPVIIGDQLVGLGSGDMKGAIAGMVYAAAALANLGHFSGRLALALTADEENGSVYGSKWLASAGLIEADVCVIGEPGGIQQEWESLHLVSRGVALFRVVVLGTQMHSSISDQLPSVNATLKMAALALKMQNELHSYLTFDEHPFCKHGPTINVGVMASAGVTYGVFPGRAEFACDTRTLPGMTEEQIQLDIQRFLDDAMAQDPELRATLEWNRMMGATEIDSNNDVIQVLQSTSEMVLGRAPVLDAFPGATDAAYIQTAAGVPCVASFGPGFLPRAHSPNESMHKDGPAQAAMIYALSALRYLNG